MMIFFRNEYEMARNGIRNTHVFMPETRPSVFLPVSYCFVLSIYETVYETTTKCLRAALSTRTPCCCCADLDAEDQDLDAAEDYGREVACESTLDVEEEYSDGHLSPVILAIQNIYDHPSRNLSPDLISHFISVLPLPCAVDGQNCIVESDGLPNSFEHSFWKFTPSELRLYRLSNKHHWTQHELREVITLIRDPTFTARDIGPDLESRVRPIQFVKF